MGEIKFRAKRIDNGEWVYGLLIRKLKKHTAIELCTIGKEINSELFIQEVKRISNVDVLIEFKVIPETVGQFTGLKDKNGVEVYEGDIVKFIGGYIPDDEIRKGTVIFKDCCFHINDDYELLRDTSAGHLDCEVIGNIYEGVVQISEGGSDFIENIQPLCRNCNSRKWKTYIHENPNLLK